MGLIGFLRETELLSPVFFSALSLPLQGTLGCRLKIWSSYHRSTEATDSAGLAAALRPDVSHFCSQPTIYECISFRLILDGTFDGYLQFLTSWPYSRRYVFEVEEISYDLKLHAVWSSVPNVHHSDHVATIHRWHCDIVRWMQLG
jgi:hypothetical protein